MGFMKSNNLIGTSSSPGRSSIVASQAGPKEQRGNTNQLDQSVSISAPAEPTRYLPGIPYQDGRKPITSHASDNRGSGRLAALDFDITVKASACLLALRGVNNQPKSRKLAGDIVVPDDATTPPSQSPLPRPGTIHLGQTEAASSAHRQKEHARWRMKPSQ
jgi:hypothetical protein